MAGQTLASYDAALKDTYGPGLRNALNNSNPILTEVVKDTTSFSGRQVVWSVHSGRSSATGARAEGATLPTPDNQRYIQPKDTLAYIYHTIQVSGQALHLTQNQAGAFAKALDQEMKGAEKDLKNDLARQMFNGANTVNGVLVNGAIARVSAVTSSTVVHIELPSDTDSNVDASANDSIWRKFFVGEIIDFVTPATGVITATATITAITPASGTITTTTNTGVVDADLIYRSGAVVSGGAENEINGLPFLVGTQNYAGITASSNPVWNSPTVGSATEGISENLIESAIEKVQTDGDGSTPTLAVAEQSQGRKLASLIQQQKRYAPPSVKLTAGWTGIEVAGLNLVFDRYCPTANIFVLTPSELAWMVGFDWDWDTDDGQVLTKSTTSDAVVARYKGYVNLETFTRNAHVKVLVSNPSF